MEMIKKIRISTLNEYISNIEKHCCDREDILFRGQEKDYPLVPRIGRLHLAEDLLKTEQKMFREFKRRSRPYLNITHNLSWDWLALAQHHRMATRFLDWTTNPLAALWFAVYRPAVKTRKKEIEHGVVWIFKVNPKDFVDANKNPFEIKRTKVFRPNHVTKRIVAQDGWFTVHCYLKKEKEFIPLEKNTIYVDSLIKIIIPGEKFRGIRYNLDRCGVNDSSLFPDLDGICQHIEWVNSKLEDEK